MTVINTNVKALFTQASLKLTERNSMTAMQQLATGKRINSAKDDAAGLAIAARMTQQIQGLNQGIRNAGDAIAMIQTTEGATQNVTTMLLRISELAMQSSNDTYSDVQRGFLNNEFSQLKEEINRMALTHEWNGFKILAGRADGITDVDKDGTIELIDPDDPTIKGPEAAGQNKLGLILKFQVGDSAEQAIEVELPNFTQDGTVTRAIFYSDFDPADPDTHSCPEVAGSEVGNPCRLTIDPVTDNEPVTVREP